MLIDLARCVCRISCSPFAVYDPSEASEAKSMTVESPCVDIRVHSPIDDRDGDNKNVL